MIGTAEVVAAVDREQLAAFHAERYRPGSIVIAAAGSVEHDALLELVARCAAPARSTAPARAARPRARQRRSSRAARVPRRKTPSSTTSASAAPGSRRDDERRFALRVLEGILGGTSSSRLFQEVRERRGLAYSVFCFSNLYADTGEVGLYVGTRPENLDEALEVRRRASCDAASADPASEEELVRSRENLKGRMVLGARVDRGAHGPARRRRAQRRCRSCRSTR